MQNGVHRVLGIGLVAGLGLGLSVGLLGGCTSSAVYSGHDYTLQAIDGQVVNDREQVVGVVREVLTDYRFVIDRVDARRGVVTTGFKTTQGLVSPWDGEQSSLTQETADFVNQHERAVRVLINDDGSVVVSVMVQRVHRPGWRIETESIARSTHTTVIGTDGRRQPSRLVTPIGNDGELARRIGEQIGKRLGSKATSG